MARLRPPCSAQAPNWPWRLKAASRRWRPKAWRPASSRSPSFELFEQQDAAYQASVIGRGTVRVAVEAAIKQGWERFIGEDGAFIGMTGFGASAPAEVLYEKFGITSDAIVAAVKARL